MAGPETVVVGSLVRKALLGFLAAGLALAAFWETPALPALSATTRAQVYLDLTRAGRIASLTVVVAVCRWAPRTPAQALALVLAASAGLDLIGPLAGDAWSRWDVGRPLAAVTWVVAGAILWWWKR